MVLLCLKGFLSLRLIPDLLSSRALFYHQVAFPIIVLANFRAACEFLAEYELAKSTILFQKIVNTLGPKFQVYYHESLVKQY